MPLSLQLIDFFTNEFTATHSEKIFDDVVVDYSVMQRLMCINVKNDRRRRT